MSLQALSVLPRNRKKTNGKRTTGKKRNCEKRVYLEGEIEDDKEDQKE